MEKTLSSISGAISGLLSHYSGFTKEFQALVNTIGEARTKHEEDRIVRAECKTLQDRLKQPDISRKLLREYLVRLIYCEMLGHDASFGHIQAIKFAQQTGLLEKRIGYLAVCLLLHDGHELIVLLINTLQKDLNSSNVLENCMALTVAAKMVGSEMIPAVLSAVVAKLKHPRELVRKKAVLALHHFYQKSPSSVSHLHDDFRRALCDKDPGVMEASLGLFIELAKDDSRLIKDLNPSFVAILKQIIDRKLAKDFEYHSVPAPWIQIKILRILAAIGTDDLKCSEGMYEVIGLCMDRADSDNPINYAILYECIRTVTLIYPNSVMIQRCAKKVGRFLSSKASNNLKCTGITALTSLVAVDSKVAIEHQMVVIECLDDPDDTLKRKTLDLLFKMTNPVNVEVICDRLINYLRSTVDQYLRADLVDRITQLAERYSPDNAWFISTMNAVFELGGNLVRKEVAHNLLRLIAEGSDDETADTGLRLYALSSYMELIEKACLPDILIQVIAWILGEYSYVLDDSNLDDILLKLIELLRRDFTDPSTSGWIITAVTKVVSQLGTCPEAARALSQSYAHSGSIDLQQRACELEALVANPMLMSQALPVDASCEDIEVDFSLSFLDQFVADSLVRGASRYKPATQRRKHQKESVSHGAALNFLPYAPPPKPSSVPLQPVVVAPSPPSPPAPREERDIDIPSEPPQPQNEPKVEAVGLKAPRLWGRTGYARKTQGSSPGPERKPEPIPPRAVALETEVAEETPPEKDVEEGEVSVEETRKKALASALFGGVELSRKSASKKDKVLKAVGAKKAKGFSRVVPPASSSALVSFDGLGLDADLMTSESRSAADVPPPPSSSVDLLLDLEGLDLSATPAPPPVAESSLLAIEPMIQEPQEKAMIQEPPQSREKSPSEGFEFSFMQKTGSPPPEDASKQLLLESQTPLTSFSIPEELRDYPVATKDNQDVCHDPCLRVTCRKILMPSQLAIVFYLTNQKSSSLRSVRVQLELPGSFKATIDGEDKLEWEKEIASFATSVHVLKLSAQSPDLQMNLRGEILIRDATQQRLFFAFPLEISDLLRPAVDMTTAEFGKLWSKGHSFHDAKLNIGTSKIQNPKDFMDKAKENLNLHPIQIIGKEGIVAGNFLSTNLLCLIHGKVPSSGKIDVWIKTRHNILTGAVKKASENAFA